MSASQPKQKSAFAPKADIAGLGDRHFFGDHAKNFCAGPGIYKREDGKVSGELFVSQLAGERHEFWIYFDLTVAQLPPLWAEGLVADDVLEDERALALLPIAIVDPKLVPCRSDASDLSVGKSALPKIEH